MLIAPPDTSLAFMATAISDGSAIVVAEADGKGEDIHPIVVSPVDGAAQCGCVMAGLDKHRVGQLRRHQPAQGKQAQLQPQQEQRQAHQYPEEAPQDFAEVRGFPAQYQELETEDNHGDGQHVIDSTQGDIRYCSHDVHQISMP